MNLVVSSKIQLKRQKYKSYSPTKLTNAFLDVTDNKLSVAKAARKYCIPEQTLRDRVLGHISIDNVKSGPPPIFDCEQEARLVKHIKDMGAVGYAYTRAEVVNLGTEYAVHLDLKNHDDKPLSLRWFYSFLDRWPELKVWRPKTISELRAKATSRESINRYFDELSRIMDKYGLKDSPQGIYNVDEKGLQPNFKPPNVVASAEYVPSTIASEKGPTTTVIGCGNALGQQIPPYFIFAGQRMRQELLEGATPGADGTVSETGWSNSEIFQSYLQNHFIKYVTGMQDKPIMLLYDGHRTHITPDIIDWAIEKKIVLYVLPPHTSHVLQPMDVGCFGPFAKIYSSECHRFQRSHSTVINRYNLCSIACKSYNSALSPSNLQSAFRKSGIYPLNRDAIDQSLFSISDAIHNQHQSVENCPLDVTHATEEPVADIVTPAREEPVVDFITPVTEEQVADVIIPVTEPVEENVQIYVAEKIPDKQNKSSSQSFFTDKCKTMPKKKPKKERRSIYKIVAGKAITEPETCEKVKEYVEQSKTSNKSKKFKSNLQSTEEKSTKKSKITAPKRKFKTTPSSTVNGSSGTKRKRKPAKSNSQQPGPSGMQKILVSDDSFTDEGEEDDDTLCCVCKMWQPKELQQCISVVFTPWAKCDFQGCDHWTHLKYCCDVAVLRRSDKFFCPCHGMPCKQNQFEE